MMPMRIIGGLIALYVPIAFADESEDWLHIEVTTSPPKYASAVVQILPNGNALDNTNTSTSSLATLLEDSPAINLNGQGGLFQTVNIRGFARWRIQTLIESVPVHTERRAGNTMEFVSPSMVEQAYVIPGAASSQLGSGAIGGGVDVFLKSPLHTELSLSFGPANDYREVLLAGSNANSDFSWMLNHRHSNNSNDGDGQPIQDQFEKHSLVLRKQSDSGLLREGILLLSEANNISKASAHDPLERLTIYPTNHHQLGKAVFGWFNATIYAHQSKLQTDIIRPEQRLNQLASEALNSGFHISDDVDANGLALRWRVGLDNRLGVRVDEQRFSLIDASTAIQQNIDAEQWEMYGSTDLSGKTALGSWAIGARLAHMRQDDQRANMAVRDSNFSAFAGYRYAASEHLSLATYISRGYRVPSLTERFYQGSTPRGETLGNSELNTEQAINIELSLQYQLSQLTFSMAIFAQRIEDYIERVDVSQRLRQYRNLSSASVKGVNYQFSKRFVLGHFDTEVKMSGQWLQGEDDAGLLIADIPPHQHRLSLAAYGDNSYAFVAVTHRQSSGDVVNGELPTDSVTTVDIGYDYDFQSSWRTGLRLTNITDRLYVTSRDDLAPFAQGRALVLQLDYHF